MEDVNPEFAAFQSKNVCTKPLSSSYYIEGAVSLEDEELCSSRWLP